MVIYRAGECFKTNIFFNESKKKSYDFIGHPTISLFPTDELDENIYCLYMTSDKSRYNYNKKIYYAIQFEKQSYLNLRHLIRIPNYFNKIDYTFSNNKLLEILKSFYNYQTKNKESEFFAEIKEKIEAEIVLLTLAKDTPSFIVTPELLRKAERLGSIWRNALIAQDTEGFEEQTLIKNEKIRNAKEIIESFMGQESFEIETMYRVLRSKFEDDFEKILSCVDILMALEGNAKKRKYKIACDLMMLHCNKEFEAKDEEPKIEADEK